MRTEAKCKRVGGAMRIFRSRLVLAAISAASLVACGKTSTESSGAASAPTVSSKQVDTSARRDTDKPPAPPVVVTPQDYIYGNWTVSALRFWPNPYPAFKPNEHDPAWLGAKVSISKGLISISPPPKGVRRHYATPTCTQPIYYMSSDWDELSRDGDGNLDAIFGLTPQKQRYFYDLECNGDFPKDDKRDSNGHVSELTPEEASGPLYLYAYSSSRIEIIWNTDPFRILLLDRVAG